MEPTPPALQGAAPTGIIQRRELILLAAVTIATAIFAADLLSSLQGALAVLYITVVLLVAQIGGRTWVLAAGAVCMLLTTIAFAAWHLEGPVDGAYSRFFVSLLAIVITTLLSMRDRSARSTLAEQARILELSHDTVVIRDPDDTIVYWNEGAEQLYGWTRAEALGRNCTELLQCAYPAGEVQVTIREHGQWSGEMTRTRRDGRRLVLATRWLQRRDPEGRDIGVIETSADLTEQRHADQQRHVSERRYSTIFHAAGFATWESDWSPLRKELEEMATRVPDLRAWLMRHPGEALRLAAAAIIRDANQAAADLFGVAGREDLIGGNIVGDFAQTTDTACAEILAALIEGAEMAEAETRFRTVSGGHVDVVLRVTLMPEGEPWSRALVMAYDLTERNEARAKLEQTSAELAHAARVSTLGQLAASIAHEVNQPLAAIVNYGKSGKRWIDRATPDLDEVSNCLDRIIANSNRATEVISRVRALARKTAPQAEPLDMDQLIDEAVELVRREARNHDVTMRRVVQPSLPLVIGDRVQVQQVVVNLLMNAIQAMRDIQGRMRELCIHMEATDDMMVRVAVMDCGSGFGDTDPARIFEPFFTTKGEGMGMGLSICRSIIESQGGRISATNNDGHGATVAFTLPANDAVQAAVA